MRLLLIEDNPADVRLVQDALDDAIELTIQHDGGVALEVLRGQVGTLALPDLIILDLKLPPLGGLGVLRALRDDEALARIPTVVLTSSEAPRDVASAYGLGARACFTKPAVGLGELVGDIARVLGRAVPPPGAPVLATPPPPAPLPEQGQELARLRHTAAALDSLPEAIVSVDLELRIRTFNRGAEQLFGYFAHEAVGAPVELILPRDTAALHEPVDRYVMVPRADREGRERFLQLRLAPILDLAGNHLGHAIVARDTTDDQHSDDRFRMAVEASPSAMVMVDPSGNIVLVNAETERLFGYSRSELVGRCVDELVPERYRERHPELRTDFFHTPEARVMGAGRELHGLRKDGREVPVEIGLTPVSTPEGMYTLSSIVDVSERQLAQRRFRLAVEASPSGMVMVDGAGTIVMANAQACRMFGYRQGELVGQCIELLVPRRFRGHHSKLRDGFAREPEARTMGTGRDLHGVRKDGSELPVEVGLNPIDTAAGLVVLCTIVDITERKRAERDLAQKAEELARSNEDLEQFAYVASHDLQEPLRTVSSYTTLLAERYSDRLDDDGRTFVEFARTAAMRMRRLIRELLEYSRVNRKGKELMPIDLSEPLALATKMLAVELARRDAVVECHVDVRVLADATQLLMVFQNLLSNAIKFCTGRPHIVVAARSQGDRVHCTVKDNGLGIAPEHTHRIFQMFDRLHTQEEFEGTGIGLAMCKRIIERHGGRIFVESEPGAGSTFGFTLPAAPP